MIRIIDVLIIAFNVVSILDTYVNPLPWHGANVLCTALSGAVIGAILCNHYVGREDEDRQE